jgi:hypothetical protein
MATPQEVARKVQGKVDDLISPLQIEMDIMKWKPEFRVIIWEALAHKAISLAREATKKVQS